MERMAKELPRGRYLYCPHGSRLAMYDDRQTYLCAGGGMPSTRV